MKLFSHFWTLIEQVATTEEMTEAKRAVINETFQLYHQWLEPKPRYETSNDRMSYQISYTAERLGVLTEENSAIARQYLKAFPQEEIRKMQYGTVTNSQTQQIVTTLAKELYPDL